MTEKDRRQQQALMLLEHKEATEELQRLLHLARRNGHKLAAVADLLIGREFSGNPEKSEVDLLSLPANEYESVVNLTAIKALANSIAVARRKLADVSDQKVRLGY